MCIRNKNSVIKFLLFLRCEKKCASADDFLFFFVRILWVVVIFVLFFTEKKTKNTVEFY